MKITVAVVEIIILVIGAIGFLAFLASTYNWIRRGYPIPRWLHICAILSFIAGTAIGLSILLFMEVTSWVVVVCSALPPASMYAGWIWMCGPEFDKKHMKGREEKVESGNV